ncbi:MAG: hypothetical protein GOVbin1709_23 [Prokaryotic dsDNA virus sp.]|nr:MAG: hypothetical protein GOVbin1709_23 [Prokaryotic dsDNA virus sp.]
MVGSPAVGTFLRYTNPGYLITQPGQTPTNDPDTVLCMEYMGRADTTLPNQSASLQAWIIANHGSGNIVIKDYGNNFFTNHGGQTFSSNSLCCDTSFFGLGVDDPTLTGIPPKPPKPPTGLPGQVYSPCDPKPAILSNPEFCINCHSGGYYGAGGGWGGSGEHPHCQCCEDTFPDDPIGSNQPRLGKSADDQSLNVYTGLPITNQPRLGRLSEGQDIDIHPEGVTGAVYSTHIQRFNTAPATSCTSKSGVVSFHLEAEISIVPGPYAGSTQWPYTTGYAGPHGWITSNSPATTWSGVGEQEWDIYLLDANGISLTLDPIVLAAFTTGTQAPGFTLAIAHNPSPPGSGLPSYYTITKTNHTFTTPVNGSIDSPSWYVSQGTYHAGILDYRVDGVSSDLGLNSVCNCCTTYTASGTPVIGTTQLDCPHRKSVTVGTVPGVLCPPAYFCDDYNCFEILYAGDPGWIPYGSYPGSGTSSYTPPPTIYNPATQILDWQAFNTATTHPRGQAAFAPGQPWHGSTNVSQLWAAQGIINSYTPFKGTLDDCINCCGGMNQPAYLNGGSNPFYAWVQANGWQFGQGQPLYGQFMPHMYSNFGITGCGVYP